MSVDLQGVSVVVAGAGLAGLAAGRDLVNMGATVTVIDARDRVGGRVFTARREFVEGQHAEAGGDMIDDDHQEIRRLAEELGLETTRILRAGFGAVRADASGHVAIVEQNGEGAWERLADQLSPLVQRYRVAERRWDSPIAAELARTSVAEWLDDVGADEELRATATGLRGFFLADPEGLSLLALVDQFAAEESPALGKMYRIQGGNDRLASTIAEALRNRLQLGTELVAVSQPPHPITLTLRSASGTRHMQCDYLLFALPTNVLRHISITPALPAQQHEAIARLQYGRATKTLLQFSERFWDVTGRPRAFGSSLPFGAVWDGNEEQRGKPGILSLLAGGSASAATAHIAIEKGVAGLARALEWLGSRDAQLIGSHQTVWENEPWSRGGYAVFDPSFDPRLRGWLAQPCGALFFAGEHTSIRWQGYMNGAVESGRRAAAEIAATHRLGNTTVRS